MIWGFESLCSGQVIERLCSRQGTEQPCSSICFAIAKSQSGLAVEGHTVIAVAKSQSRVERLFTVRFERVFSVLRTSIWRTMGLSSENQETLQSMRAYGKGVCTMGNAPWGYIWERGPHLVPCASSVPSIVAHPMWIRAPLGVRIAKSQVRILGFRRWFESASKCSSEWKSTTLPSIL